MKVAVYGSLRKGMGNHPVMERAGGKYLGTERIEGFLMKAYCPYYPACEQEENSSIVAEIYEVSDLRPLDALEGYSEGSPSNFYDRVVAATSYGYTYIYVINGVDAPVVEGGDWVAYKKAV